MAAAENGTIKSREEAKPNSHRKSFSELFQELAPGYGISRLFEYNTDCETTPTSWYIDLIFERGSGGLYNFSTKATRIDNSGNSVKATLTVLFRNSSYDIVLAPIIHSKEGLTRNDKLEGYHRNIDMGRIWNLEMVHVTIVIEDCHKEASNLQCASEAITVKRINQKNKL